MGEFLLGVLIGMRHALDADHLSAVATLLNQRGASLRQGMQQGVAWGVGHSLTLMLFAVLVLVTGQGISDQLASGLEWAVGGMLVLLGIDVLRRLHQQRMHVHSHRHDDGRVHLHAHSHPPGIPGQADPHPAIHQHGHQPDHQHSHFKGLPVRALLVGMMHGMAGSAALLVLMVGVADSTWTGLFYVLLFGVGTLLGMASLTVAFVLPLRLSKNHLAPQHFERLYAGLQLTIACFSLGLGGTIMVQHWGGWSVG